MFPYFKVFEKEAACPTKGDASTVNKVLLHFVAVTLIYSLYCVVICGVLDAIFLWFFTILLSRQVGIPTKARAGFFSNWVWLQARPNWHYKKARNFVSTQDREIVGLQLNTSWFNHKFALKHKSSQFAYICSYFHHKICSLDHHRSS